MAVKVKATDVPKKKKVPMSAPKKPKADKTKMGKSPNLSTLTNWLKFADEASKGRHWEWFVVNQFLEGKHDVRGNPHDNTIVVSKQRESINFPINKIYSAHRSLTAFVTRHQPKVEVEPKNSTDEARDYARRSNKVLERDNQLNNGKKLNHELAYLGVEYGRAWRQIGYDKEKQVSIRWTVDPMDILIGAKTGNWEDAPYLIKNIVRTIGYWKNKYPKSDVAPDNEVAYDEYKKLMHEINQNSYGENSQEEDEETAIGHECWYKLFKPNKMGGLINKVLFTDKEILDFQETPFTEYPFVAYDAEARPNEIHPPIPLKHAIPAQRMINILNTQLIEYNHIVNRGRFVKDKNAGFRAIYAKEGQIIEKNQGKSLQVLPPPPINPALQNQITLAETWLEDITGMHDASRGITPERVTSGRAIEALQMGDSNNVQMLRENFEDALAKEAAWILKMYSLFEKDGFMVDDKLKEDEIDTFGVIGQEAVGGNVPKEYFMEENGEYSDICAILPDNQVKVSVTSELGETRQARMGLLMELVQMGLPFKTLLEYLEFPNTSDVLERIAEEPVGQQLLGGVGQPNGEAAPPQEAPPPPPPGSEDLIAELEG
jgi:hypothetical protein